jgi:hypothetical protein
MGRRATGVVKQNVPSKQIYLSMKIRLIYPSTLGITQQGVCAICQTLVIFCNTSEIAQMFWGFLKKCSDR